MRLTSSHIFLGYIQKSFAVPTKPVYLHLHYNPPENYLTYFVSVMHF